MQKKFVVLALAAFVLAGCATVGESIGLGAGVGAAGSALVGGDPVTGAIIGGGLGYACDTGWICN
ncbi:MAG: hypothetical protein COA53_08570 [Rhodobacteraceae bacterium]|nr:MAG: hypothetical protein COA53_08570 [Paracoccaceae bacterium]